MKKEAILWTACMRPEYAKVSLESIFSAIDDDIDFYAFVDNSGDNRSLEIVNILKQYPAFITHRERNYSPAENFLDAAESLYVSGYETFHEIEEDIIISKNFFKKGREILSNPDITLFFGTLINDENRNNITETGFLPWGISYKKSFYEYMRPYVNPFLESRTIGIDTTKSFLLESFKNESISAIGPDGLMHRVMQKYKLKGQWGDRSYAKDIGAYGKHRLKGKIPIKTLQEWADTPPTNQPGYGIQGIDFIL